MPWILLLALLAAPQPPPQAPPPLAVFVDTVRQPVNGYVTPFPKEMLDLLKRFTKELRKYRGVRFVQSSGPADITISLTEWRYESEEDGVVAMAHRTASGAIMAGARPRYNNYVVVELALVTADTSVNRLSVNAESSKKAASALAVDVAAWLNANEQAIRRAKR